MTTEKRPAPKAKVTRDSSLCHWGAGSYLSPKSSKKCPNPHHPKRQLCDQHELAFRAARKAASPVKPKLAVVNPTPTT